MLEILTKACEEKNTQAFVIESKSHEVFSELSNAGVSERDGTFERGLKCVDCALGLEGLLNVAEGIDSKEQMKLQIPNTEDA